MKEIELSVFDHGPESIAELQSLLKQFEAEQKVRVHLDVIPWSGSWSKLVRVALYHDGPDVSEIGTTWVADFVRMDALARLGRQEIRTVGGQESFLPSIWQSGALASNGEKIPSALWGVPWITDTRLVFYRRDLLAQAGIDERSAFQNPEQFERTLARLQESGIQTPLVIPTAKTRMSIHFLASWVWGAGGDFLAKDGSHVTFQQPEAVAGFKSYFSLGRYLSRDARGLDDIPSYEMFWRGDAAVTLSGPWMLRESQIAPQVAANLGVALPPGTPFVGGFHLAVWKHTRRKREVIRLIKFLASSQAALSLFPIIGLPARLDALANPPFSNEPAYQVMSKALRIGRSLPSEQLWGLVESRLTDTIPWIWQDVLARSEPELDIILDERLNSLADRITTALGI
jgi:multiple sugar transport system substrate-binding protein